MSRADHIKRGDWIVIDGKTVKVTAIRNPGYGAPVEIDWAFGSRSGMRVRDGKAQVQKVYTPRGKQ